MVTKTNMAQQKLNLKMLLEVSKTVSQGSSEEEIEVYRPSTQKKRILD